MNRLIRTLILFVILIIAVSPTAEVIRKEIGNLVIENIPDIPDRIVEGMRRYQNTRSASFQGWLPDGQGVLVSTRFGQTTQLHAVATPEGARRQLTFFDEPIRTATVSPDPIAPGVLFTKDVGGAESYQLFYYNASTGVSSMVSDGTSRNGFEKWSNSGQKFAYNTTRRNGKDYDIVVADMSDPTNARTVFEGTGWWGVLSWSVDDSWLLLENYISRNESSVYMLDLNNGKAVQISPSDEKISYDGGIWSKDGRGIYVASDDGTEFRQLRYYDIASQTFTNLSADIPWDVSGMALSPQGDLLAFAVNNNGAGRLHLLDTYTGQQREVNGLPPGQISGLEFSPDGTQLGLSFSTPTSVGDVYSLIIATEWLVRWTISEMGGLIEDNLTMPTLIAYPTFDSVNGQPRMIPAYYFRPSGGNAGDRIPVIVYIHGGPESQYLPKFSATMQYFVNELGIAVVAPNVRGSAGYGKSYLLMDNGFGREGSVADIGTLLDWIEQQPELDSDRVIVYGGSYGGFMVLASMTNYNARLRAGIDVVGISNFVTFLENTKPYRQNLRRAEYGDERDPEMRKFLERISPTTNSHKITKPMFIIQGLNDPRVPASEAEQMLATIRKNGSDAWYLLAKDEGHGFRKKKNRDFYNHAIVLFLEDVLK